MSEYSRTTYNFNNRFTLNSEADSDKMALLRTDTIFDTTVENVEDERVEQPGIIDYGSKLSKGILRLPLYLYATSDANMGSLIEDIKEAFNPDLCEADATYGIDTVYKGYHPLKFSENIGGTTWNMQVYSKPLEIPKLVNDSYGGLIRECEVKLKVMDPRKYNQTQSTLAGAGTANNQGKYPTPVVITGTATGATSTSLQITNSTTGETIYITTALANEDVIVIDTRNHSIKKNGTETRSLIGAGTKWWNLDPGNNTIAYTNSTNITFSLAWNHAWPL